MARYFTTAHHSDEDVELMTFYIWSQDDVFTIQSRLFEDALQQLADSRTSKRTKAQLLKWCFAEDCLAFSFQVCCNVQHIDHVVLQQAIRRIFLDIYPTVKTVEE